MIAKIITVLKVSFLYHIYTNNPCCQGLLVADHQEQETGTWGRL